MTTLILVSLVVVTENILKVDVYVQQNILMMVAVYVHNAHRNVMNVIWTVTVPFVELTLDQSHSVIVTLTISLPCIKTKKFVKFVTSDVSNVLESSITVTNVPVVPEDTEPQNVTAQKVS